MLSENQLQRALFDVISEIDGLQRQAIQLKFKLDDALAKKENIERELAKIQEYSPSSVLSQQMTMDLLKSEVGDLC